jgi:hypothetical protein
MQVPLAAPHSSRTLIGVAWGTTILASTLPEIVLIQLTPSSFEWLTYAKLGLLVALILVSLAWKPLRPLRNYFIALVAFFGLNWLRLRINFTIPGLQALFGNSVFDSRMQAEQTGKLAMSSAMIGLLLLLGYSRLQLYLTRGNVRAAIRPVPLLGFPKADPWWRFGLQWGVYIAGALVLLQYLTLRPAGGVLVKVLPILPSILFYAALNAINEELFYRVPSLATLENVVGGRQALWMSTYFFGIAHYFGTPGGLPGGIASMFMGWILGKGILETRGLWWSWWIHFLSDVAIFTFLTASLLR